MRELGACEHRGAWVVTLPPRLLADTEEPLLAAVRAGLARSSRVVVLDMTCVALMDTTGIGALVSALHLACEAGARVVLAGASGRPRILLDRVHLGRHAQIHDSLEDALKDAAP